MTRAQLEHAIRAIADIAQIDSVVVVGSQAILGTQPEAPPFLRRSIELDVIPGGSPERADQVEGALGELSQFHSTHGFYVQVLDEDAVKLPAGWRSRLFEVRNDGTRGAAGYCLDPSDLAASKLAAFRPKDLDFVRVMLEHRIISAEILERRLRELPRDAPVDRCLAWLRRTSADFSAE